MRGRPRKAKAHIRFVGIVLLFHLRFRTMVSVRIDGADSTIGIECGINGTPRGKSRQPPVGKQTNRSRRTLQIVCHRTGCIG